MKHSILFSLLIIAVVLLTSCQENYASVEFDVYEGGVNVNRVNLTKDSAHQLNYKVHLPFPNTNVLDFYRRKFSDSGWKECLPLGEWRIHAKNENSKNVHIRQKLSYAVHLETNRFLMLNLQYFSEQTEVVNDKPIWNDENQYVTLIIYETDNLSIIADNLSINCPLY